MSVRLCILQLRFKRFMIEHIQLVMKSKKIKRALLVKERAEEL